jgi:Na+/phosphate symporter
LRWTDIITSTISMEQISDIIERVLLAHRGTKIKPRR